MIMKTTMKKIFNIFFLCLVLTTTGTLAGCAAWLESFNADPIGTLERTIGYIFNAIDLAKVAFNMFKMSAPDLATQAEPTFITLEAKVREALTIAMDGLKIAADTRQTNPPDPQVLLKDVYTALGDLEKFISSLSSTPAGAHAAASPEMQAAMHALQNAQHYSRP